MSLSALCILDNIGQVLIFRDYRGDINLSIIDNFFYLLQRQEIEEGITSPLIKNGATTFAYIKHDNLYITSLIRKNANLVLVFLFMQQFIEIATLYFGRLEEESIKDNFVVIYELLDEIIDFGYPQTTDPKILQTYIFQQGQKLRHVPILPNVVTNIVSWRPQGLKYRKNELFVDVVEAINLRVNSNGTIVQNEITGSVKMKVNLSGMPQLRLGLNDQIVIDRFEDFKFHQCVQLSRILDKNICFIPPDGDFELMSYRITADFKPLIDLHTRTWATSSKLEYKIRITAQFKKTATANNLEILIPVFDADSPVFQTTKGTVTFSPETQGFVWRIKYFSGGSEALLKAQFKLSSVKSEDRQQAAPIQIQFVVPYFTLSGLQIKYLKVIEKSNYKALTWVRYTTKNGDYLISFN